MVYTSQRSMRELHSKRLEVNTGLIGSVKASAPSPSPTDMTDEEEASFSKTPESRSGAGSPTTADGGESESIYCVEYLNQLSDRATVKMRKTCHRCGNIRKNNIACNSCEQIFCKACARKFEQDSQTGFKFDESKDGCPVCLKLCCCANPKGHDCKSMIHCYRRCEVSRKQSKRRAKVNANSEKKVPYNYQHKRGVLPPPKVTPVGAGKHSAMPPLAPIMVPSVSMSTINSEFSRASYSPYMMGTPVMARLSEHNDGGDDAHLEKFSEVDVDQIKIEPEGFMGLDILAKVASTSLLMSS